MSERERMARSAIPTGLRFVDRTGVGPVLDTRCKLNAALRFLIKVRVCSLLQSRPRLS